jgi:MGT family glycosyltransferase
MNASITSSAARRRYLFTLVDGGGTVPPELGTVRRLTARGHDVTVLAEDTMADEVRATGARFVRWSTAPNRPTRLPDDDPYRDWECRSTMKLFDRLLERQFAGPAAAYAADVTAAIDEQRPDLVVCTMFTPGAMLAAEAAGVPFDIVFPNIYMLPAPGRPPIGLGLQPARGAFGRIRDRIVQNVSDRSWNNGLDRLNAVRAQYGLVALDRFWAQADVARRHIVLTSSGFDFTGQVPDRVRYVGAVLDDPAWSTAADAWTAPAADEPLVLVALSSTFQDQGGCVQRVIDAVGSLPVQAIVTTGPALDPSTLDAPSNVEVRRSAPHSAILPHAAAVVTHGGHGTVIKSLAAGVPLVILPHGRDQTDNAARVVARHAGVKLAKDSKAKVIATAIAEVLADDAYRVGAAALGEVIRTDAASGALIAELEDVPMTCPI